MTMTTHDYDDDHHDDDYHDDHHDYHDDHHHDDDDDEVSKHRSPLFVLHCPLTSGSR